MFAPRKQEADAKDFFDNDHVIERMFQKDWVRVARQDRFYNYIRREGKKAAEKTAHPGGDGGGDKDGGGDETEKVFKDLETLMVTSYRQIAGAFTYYASLGSGSLGGLQLNEYTEFLENCKIPDANSKSIKRSDCDTLFITADFVEDKKSDEAEHMEGGALLRFEFLEVIIRHKYSIVLQYALECLITWDVLLLAAKEAPKPTHRNEVRALCTRSNHAL